MPIKKIRQASVTFLIVVVLYIFVQIALSFLMQGRPQDDEFSFVATTLIIQLLALFIPGFILVRGFGADFSGFRSIRARPMLLVLPMMLCSYILSVFLNLVSLFVYTSLGGVVNAEANVLGQFTQPEQLPMMLLVAALLPGLVEETVFRGGLLSAYGQLGRIRGALLSGLAFALMHLNLPYQLPSLFLLGALLGLLRFDTRSIYPSMLFHFFNNAMALLLATVLLPGAAPPQSAVPPWLDMDAFMQMSLGIGALVFLPVAAAAATLLFFLWGRLRKPVRGAQEWVARGYYETPKAAAAQRPLTGGAALIPLYVGIGVLALFQTALIILQNMIP